MPFLAGISSFFDKYILGYAIGTAAGPSLEPFVQDLANLAWTENQVMPPDAMTLALGVAQGQVDPAQAQSWASQTGFGTDQFAALVDIANVGPPLGNAYDAWRRGLLTDVEFTTALKRTGLEEQWNVAMQGLKTHLYDLAALANGMQQGFVPDGGLLQPAPDAGAATVAQNAALNIDPIAEAAKLGYSADQLQLAAELAGLPPGPELLQTWVRRGAASEQDLVNGVRQGHTKSEWAQKYLDTIPQVLGHLDYTAARVRGYITNADYYTGGALTGYAPDQLDLLHKTHGRPPSWRQVWIGIQRGGEILSPTDDLTPASTGIDPVFFAALQQSDIQQQWYDIVWHLRWNYPPPFVLRTLGADGTLNTADIQQILDFEGYEPTLAAKIATAFGGGAGQTATQKKQTLAHLTDEYLSGALSAANLTTLLTTSLGYTAEQAAEEIKLAEFGATKAVRTKNTKLIEKQYVGTKLSEAQARSDLAALGWPANVIDNYIAGWNIERNIALTTLSLAQITAALKAGTILASEATPLLEDLGESPAAIATIFQTYGTNPAT
jgi:hypothetical protein